MFIRFLLSTILVTFSLAMQAALVCPPDITVTCHDDIHYLPLVGTPTVFGGVGQLRYQDVRPNAVCNMGNIVRTWYLDANGNQNYDTGEHACIQNIYVTYISGTTTIDWPADVTITCKDNIPNDSPSWVAGPCDIVGVSHQDQVFETDSKACYKILRTFTVINWCTYVPNTNIGIWSHTQVIKINDPIKPSILKCGDVTLGTDQGCQANFQVSNVAIDLSPCGQQSLYWSASVDLWSDGSFEYTYSYNSSDSTRLLPVVKSGQQVGFKLPYPVIRGYHKVIWTVHDQCGNVSTCEQKVHIKDDKRPTPYMHDVLFSSFEGNDFPLKVPARIFNLGSFDNCSNARYLKYSFSTNVNDTIRMVNCSNAGFQYFTIYVTDLEGNQEYTEVFMLAFDNGSCQNQLRMKGTVAESNKRPMASVAMRLTKPDDLQMNLVAKSDVDGQFAWENISLYKNLEISPEYSGGISEGRLDVADLRLLQDYIMGLYKLKNFEFLAADLNDDKQIRIKDLEILRDQILEPNLVVDPWRFSCGMDSLTTASDIKNVKGKVILGEIKGPLDFKAVYKGDISDANTLRSGKRSVTLLDSKMTEDGVVQYFLNNSVALSGMQLAIQLTEEMKNITVESPYFEINPSSIRIDADRILRVIVAKDMQINDQQPLFTLHCNDHLMSQTPDILEESKILLKNYITEGLRLRKASVENDVKIVPNPASTRFEILGQNVTILNIRNTGGANIPFTAQGNLVDWNPPAGLYIITVQQGDKITNHPLIKAY